MKLSGFCFLISMILILACKNKDNKSLYPNHIFEYSENLDSRWISFENITGEKSRGGMANHGAKGHAYDIIPAGETITLVDIEGPGIINRIWMTIRRRSSYELRSLIINIYWDNEEKPAVSAPLGDFFGIGLGRTATFESALFSNPEGRSFNSYIQMPFKKAAKIEIVNEMEHPVTDIFFDVNLQLLKTWDESFLYFHAYWHRDTSTTLTEDFEILPLIEGKGRFLGTNLSVIANPRYGNTWWGEGEVKIYLDGDRDFPTLVGTGTEDYIGTGWGQGEFAHKYQGNPIADVSKRQWAFYRYHIIDPIYFKSDIRVTIQQIGGSSKRDVIDLQNDGVPLIPVSIIGDGPRQRHVYKAEDFNLEDPDYPRMNSWVNFYRSDDFAAVAYFYLDQPSNNLPGIQDKYIRITKLN
jgi:hypothetical protein